MPIDVCVCTHNPRLEIFTIVLTAIANQTISKDAYQVWIIDNASNPPISDLDLAPLERAGITYHLLQETRLGNMYARKLAGQVIPGESLIFVDDDNELSPDYLEIAIKILDKNPEIGYFGGKLLSGIKVVYPQWMEEVLPYIGIKDVGEKEISQCIEGNYYWGKWEPPGAGSVVRKVVLQKYFETLENLPSDLVIGRQGSKGLLSCEDSLIAKCSYDLGLQCSYQPSLKLTHHIKPERLQFSYFFKLLFSYGRSHILLNKAMGQTIEHDVVDEVRKAFRWWRKKSISRNYLICIFAKELGVVYERLRLRY
ncbi:glycosyltransferase [Chamaesiphon sp. VAR_48_metabat_135_sub]|uniref:glycosyltransferase n=1 Tax=Chamaesiphon sp. VAR_48_metabat_135_sub TaxID=2964699 RepID=UPI00286C23DB|nr:glycosyltransferase [Chamaesiphon sp. VAR_48_metabat_135_sub]